MVGAQPGSIRGQQHQRTPHDLDELSRLRSAPRPLKPMVGSTFGRANHQARTHTESISTAPTKPQTHERPTARTSSTHHKDERKPSPSRKPMTRKGSHPVHEAITPEFRYLRTFPAGPPARTKPRPARREPDAEHSQVKLIEKIYELHMLFMTYRGCADRIEL